MGKGTLPTRVGIGEDEILNQVWMIGIHLQSHDAAPGQTAQVHRPDAEALDQSGETRGIVRESEVRGNVGGATCARFVPRDDHVFVCQRGELGPPDPAVVPGAVHQHQRRSIPDLVAADLEPVDLHEPHERKVPAN
jgi:hypothetical protein